MIDVLLVYPKLGNMDGIVVDLPLSVLYAATESVKRGFNVRILDMRLHADSGNHLLRQYLHEGVRLVGISVMTGEPLRRARDISRLIRVTSPNTKIVWGGPHCTVVPETAEEGFLDYIIRGYGSMPLAELIQSLRGEGIGLESIAGLSYRDAAGRVHHNQRSTVHEMLHYTDIPYQLAEMSNPLYIRSYSGKRFFPMFSSIGCPYNCSFCMNPAVYKILNGPKWKPYPIEQVLDHMQMAKDIFKAEHICFLDDTSFPDLHRMQQLFQGVLDRNLKLTLEFRGARVNEIDRMDDDFIDLMAQAGTRIIMVGFESANERILKSMNKGITREQIFRVNRKLARCPRITPIYNFFCGTPGETYKDLIETKDALLQILEENPSAYVGVGGDWKPVPGTKMLEMAVREYGFTPPRSIDDWIVIDTYEGTRKIKYPWYSRRHDNLIRILQASAPVIDNKFLRETKDTSSFFYRVMRVCARLYRPVALWRLRRNIYSFPMEFFIFRWLLGRTR